MFFDFLSSSQKNLTVKKPYNKNCCGICCSIAYNKNCCGICCSIAIILFIFIAGLFFIMKFRSESNYSISYTYFRNDNDLSLKNETILNNNVSFRYLSAVYNETKHTYEYKYNTSFKLLNIKKNKLVEFRETTKIQYFDYELLYECKDFKCQNEENLYDNYLYFVFMIDELDYQNKTPVKHKYYLRRIPIRKNQYRITTYNFKRVVLEDIGYFTDKNYTVLSLEDYYTSNPYDDSNIKHLYIDISGKRYKRLGNIKFEVEERESWYYYKRTEKSFMKVISDIFAMSQFIYTTINLLYLNLFSYFYDNYQIMNHILSEKKEKMKGSINISKIINSPTNRENLVDNENQDDILNIDNSDNNEKEPSAKPNSDNLPDSNYNNFIKSPLYSICSPYVWCGSSCSKCCISKDKILIEKCKEIVEEFSSIEHIIYNQILLENLLKDYRWNDENLKDYRKHKRLITLINNIQS